MDGPLGAVHKLRLQEEGGRWSKKLTFCKLLYHRKCKRRGVGGQKKQNFLNVVCERPLIEYSISCQLAINCILPIQKHYYQVGFVWSLMYFR